MADELAVRAADIPADQTPIEIALGIDSQGRTTAKRLYEFLELDKSHYNRWCQSNILANKFAEENVDYWKLAIDGEFMKGTGRGNTRDYKLTASFAKKLAMASGSPKGEIARDYFLAVEEGAKRLVKQRDEDFLRLKASYYDMEMLLKESHAEMNKLRKQLRAVESRQNEKDNRRFENTYENRIAQEFFKALDEVLSSDDNSFAIKPKNYRGSLELIGVCDDTRIYLSKRKAYYLYECYAREPVKQPILWNILLRTGYVDGLADPALKMSIGWSKEPVLVVYREKAEGLVKHKI